MSKTQDEFLDHFARLGVFSKVQALMGPPTSTEIESVKPSDELSTTVSVSVGTSSKSLSEYRKCLKKCFFIYNSCIYF